MRHSTLVPALLLSIACATAGRGPGEPSGIEFAADEVKASRLDLELEGKNDEELFAIGMAAYGAADYARAAAAFARVADLFPGSRHAAAALFKAGLAYERLDEWLLALERFRAVEIRARGEAALPARGPLGGEISARGEAALPARGPGGGGDGGPDAIEAAFRIAECQYHLDDLGDAWATLDALARRGALAPGDRVRALAQRGIVELEQGRSEDAERSLRLAISTHEAASEDQRLDDAFAAQAQFYLGEVYRGWFRALPLDPSAGDEASLQRDLEHKAEMLLSAQGHYLRAIRMGNDRWAVAAGFRVGELYDELRSQLIDAPPPPGLDEVHAAAYRSELRARVRVLATKAITAYEQTLARAARSGVEDLRFLSDAQRSLERLEAALAEDARPAM